MNNSLVSVKEKHNLSVDDQKIGFDWKMYIQLYDDLTTLESEESAYNHWTTYGQKEGRVASLFGIYQKFNLDIELIPHKFDWEEYLELNPDLNFSNKWQALYHYCQFGINENREYKSRQRQIEEDDFDWKFYLWYNTDLENIESEEEALKHWLQQGKSSRRIASPLIFYRKQGVNIKRLPSDFNFQEYLSLNPILKEEGITAQWHVISHYLKNPNFEQEYYTYKKLGIYQKSIHRYLEAIESFEQAIKFHSDDIETFIYLAQTLVLAKNWKRAVSVYRKVSKSGKVTDWALYEFSRSLLQLIKQQVEITIEDSRDSASKFLSDIEAYQKSLGQGDSRIYGNNWLDFRENFDGLLEQQLAANLELSSLRQVHQSIDSVFNFSEFIAFPVYTDPLVSIIIPVYNKIDYTVRCLRSLVQNVGADLKIEVIVINDCSTDETEEYLEDVEGLTLITNTTNSGFIHSCNAGAQRSRGEFLYFLNNDTEVLPNGIESLLEVFRNNDRAGVVGSKLVYPTGALQEAGGIIWKDSSGWNYGRNDNPLDPKYNFCRSVDYCSGASLLVRRTTFESLGGFEQNFAPAYYEDTDLCFAVRHHLGLEVIYQPKSVIVHYEGISSGTSTTSGVKRYQTVNAEKFKRKWTQALQRQPANVTGYEDAHRAARRFQGKQTVLVIDSYLPCYDKESGSRRLFQILKIFKELNYHVIFLPDDMRASEPYVSELQSMQIEVLYTCDGFGTLPEDQLKERLPLIDVAWVCRPDLMKRYLPIIRENSEIKVIYDTIDLHYLRMKRELELGLASQAAQQDMSWVDMQALELKMAMRAELTLTVTSTEQSILQQQGINSVEVVPNLHLPYEGDKPNFDERAGLLFIGGYNHPPNVDGVEWLCREIMPLVWNKIPNIKVTLLGSSPSIKVKALASENVIVPGYVADVTAYFLYNRVFVAPLRYGAGMKGKIGQSLEYALPLVSTSIGVEGMNLVSGKDCIEANSKEEFAQAILKLYTNKQVWNHISNNAEQAIQEYSPASVKKVLMRVMT